MKIFRLLLSIILILILISSFAFALETNCPYIVLIDAESGRTVYEKDAFEHVPPASTTKIMTAILVLENCKLDEMVTASYDAVMSVPSGGSSIAIQVGEQISVENLLNGLLIASGNDAANVLAEYISGSISEFANLMNQRAIELGCNDTHFLNPSGLTEEGHYSCAHDLAVMYNYAYHNFDVFRETLNKNSFSLPVSDKHSKDDRVFQNSNKLILSTSNYYYAPCTGGKTGYTSEAKNCLVSSAKSGDMELICTVLGGTNSEANLSYRYNDTINLFEYGFNSLYKVTFINAGTVVGNASVKNAPFTNSKVSAITEKPFTFYLNKESLASDFTFESSISGDLVAPIVKGQKIGSLTYNIYGKNYSIDLVADKDIEEKVVTPVASAISNILIIIVRIIIALIAIIILFRIWAIIRKKNNKSRRLFNMKRYNSRFRR